MSDAQIIVQKLWNYCNVLRDDGLSYGDYVEQLTSCSSSKWQMSARSRLTMNLPLFRQTSTGKA